MRAVAAQLYVELLRGGYTQVCEFHYLHHDVAGKPYADPATMGWAVADAAQDAGIGLTLLPVLYQRAGFAQPALRDDQRRFAGTPAMVHELARTVAGQRPRRTSTPAWPIHSLRAAGRPAIRELMAPGRRRATCPSTSTSPSRPARSTTACEATGSGPIAYLCRDLAPDARWQLVHATHATARARSTRSRAAAPASSSARPPKATWATA